MRIPGQWKPSILATRDPYGNDAFQNNGQNSMRPGAGRPTYTHNDGALPGGADFQPDYQNNMSRKVTMDTNRGLYNTSAEEPLSVAPFLLDSIVKDYDTNVAGRTYEVGAGGDTFYFRRQNTAMRTPVSEEVPRLYNTFIGSDEDNQSIQTAMTFGPRRARVRGNPPTLPFPPETSTGTEGQPAIGHFKDPGNYFAPYGR